MISQEEVDNYLTVVGKRGLEVMRVITSIRPFIEMAESEMGQELIRDDITEHSRLMNKIYDSLVKDGKAEQGDVILLQLLDRRLKKIYDRKQVYEKGVAEIKAVTKLKRRAA